MFAGGRRTDDLFAGFGDADDDVDVPLSFLLATDTGAGPASPAAADADADGDVDGGDIDDGFTSDLATSSNKKRSLPPSDAPAAATAPAHAAQPKRVRTDLPPGVDSFRNLKSFAAQVRVSDETVQGVDKEFVLGADSLAGPPPAASSAVVAAAKKSTATASAAAANASSSATAASAAVPPAGSAVMQDTSLSRNDSGGSDVLHSLQPSLQPTPQMTPDEGKKKAGSGKVQLNIRHSVRHQVAIPPDYDYVPLSEH
ncbi:hypothetical protein HK405_005610, partial [Cladochytrium tenue]